MRRDDWLRRPDRHFLLRCRRPQYVEDMRVETGDSGRIWRMEKAGWLTRAWDNERKRVFWQISAKGIEKLAEPPPAGRCTCINPACGRTWKADYEGQEIICNACFKLIPELRAEYRLARAAIKKAERSWKTKGDEAVMSDLRRRFRVVWARVREAFRREDKPDGMEAFLAEIGLKDGDEHE